MFEKNLREELEKKFRVIKEKLEEIEEIQEMGVFENPENVLEDGEIKNIKRKFNNLLEESR